MKLETRDLSLSLSGRIILDRVSLTLEPGKIVGLIGPNGAGKSSFLKALNGYFPSFRGEIRIGGSDIHTLSPPERARRVTYVGAEVETDFPLTVEEFVRLGDIGFPSRSPRHEARDVMEEVGCDRFRDRDLGELSSGERQRAHLARALYQGSNWICLDESFSRLDLHHQARMGALLRKYAREGFSFLFVSHDLNFTTDWADRTLLFCEGKLIAEGITSDVVTAENLRTLYPDADLVLAPHPLSGAMKVYFKT